MSKEFMMSVAEQAKKLYAEKFQLKLEATAIDRFVAIEPISETYYLGDRFVDAALTAKQAFPDRTSFVIRIGHEAAVHIGATSR